MHTFIKMKPKFSFHAILQRHHRKTQIKAEKQKQTNKQKKEKAPTTITKVKL